MTKNAWHPETQTDVAVVGGGLAGLSAACYLARADASVTLFERSGTVGGRAGTQTHDGYHFNQGIHALYTGGAASRVLKELGVTYRYGVPKNVATLLGGEFQSFPADPLTLLGTGLLSVGDKLALLRLFTTVSRIKSPTLASVSVKDWLEQTIRRPRVRQLMAGLARTLVYSAALDLVSADVFVEKLQRSLRHPIHYVDGGWQALVDGLRQRAVEAGVRIVTDAHVDAIAHREGRVTGARLHDGTLVSASAVVVATRARDAVKLIDPALAPNLRHAVDALMPAQIACLDVALSRIPAGHPIVEDLERPRFLTTQSLYSDVAPEGGALVYSFKQLDPNDPSSPEADERELEDLFDLALPGWRDLVVKRYFLPRIEAASSLPLARSNGLAGRPAVDVAGVANLFLAGDWVGSEGFLVDASLASAREAAERVLRNRRVATPDRLVVGTT